MGISEDTYAVRLGSLLQGKAAELYSSLEAEITADYTLLRETLLLGFGKTVDSYRLEFRSAK